MAPQREKTMMENGELPTMEKKEEEETSNGTANQLAGSHTVAKKGGRMSRGKKKSQLLGANVLNK